MSTFFSAIRRATVLTVAALTITALALAFAGCGDDDKTATAGGATAAAGSGQGASGESGGKSGGSGSDKSSKSSSGSGGSGGSGSGSGSGSDSSGESNGDSKSQNGKRRGPVIKDDNSFDEPVGTQNGGKDLSNNQSTGLGKALGQADGAADEYIGEALAAGWFKTDSKKIGDAMDDAELAAPYIMRLLLLASGSVKSGQAGTLRTDLTAAFATFEALRKLNRATAGRRVARALGTLDAALDTARKAGVKIDRSVPSRSQLRSAS